MTQDGFKRKLAAILSADVVGYSRLMEDNEVTTIQTLNAYRNSMIDLINQHRGRVVDTTGDNLMAEFSSAVDAVNCTIEIQRELGERNAELPDNRKMDFRIGVNVGDVIEEEDRIYGDGVNIAARVEALAEAGGICISGRVHDHVENKLDLKYEFMGEQSVKNISKPIRVYRVPVNPVIAASDIEIEIEVTDKPAIAVLPFVNMSGDPTQEYFSDGLTEQIITGISKIPNLFVIARNSTFIYKGRAVKAQQVGQELRVRYILEGSVQRSGERVRITAQLIDAKTGHHLWAENFDRDLEDIFDLQDEITMEILGAMRIKLTEGEQARLYVKGGTKNIKAFELAYRGVEYQYRMTPHDNAQAIQLIEEAISMDPHYSMAHYFLATCHVLDFFWNWSKSPFESLMLSERSAQKALELNDALGVPYAILGLIFLFKQQYNEAIESCEKAVSLNPNGADAHAFLGFALFCSDSIERGIVHLEKAIRLNPIPPIYYWTCLGGAYRMAGQYEKAIKCCKKAIKESPDHTMTNLILTAAYCQAGMEEEARKAAQNVVRIMPSFSAEISQNYIDM